MRRSVRPIFFGTTVLAAFFSSCGFRFVEGDKHPAIPLFPGTTNDSLLFSPVLDRTILYAHAINGLFYLRAPGSVILFDAHFDTLHRREFTTTFHVDPNGDILGLHPQDKSGDTEVHGWRAAPPDFTPRPLKKNALRWHEDPIGAELLEEGSDTWQHLDSAGISRAVERFFTDSAMCMTLATTRTSRIAALVRYPNSELLLEDVDPLRAWNVWSTDRCPEPADLKMVLPFETSVIDYKGGGNHLVGWFDQTEYHYYNIELFDRTVRFKTPHDRVCILQRNPTEVIMVIDLQLYRVTLKE